MRQTRKRELSPELKSQLREALAERFPPGWGRGKTLDQMVAETSAAALELAATLVEGEVKEPDKPGPTPVCPSPNCSRKKKGAVLGSSRSARSPS